MKKLQNHDMYRTIERKVAENGKKLFWEYIVETVNVKEEENGNQKETWKAKDLQKKDRTEGREENELSSPM